MTNDNKKQESISIKYIDKDTYTKIDTLARSKHFTGKTKKDMIEFVLHDYINMHELDEFKNPYLIQHIQSIIDASCSLMERNLGSRLAKTMFENSINLGVLNRLIMEFLNKLGNDQEAKALLNQFRQEAIDDLREAKPMSYLKLLEEESDDR